jgi:hypothetical protein
MRALSLCTNNAILEGNSRDSTHRFEPDRQVHYHLSHASSCDNAIFNINSPKKYCSFTLFFTDKSFT